MRAYLVKTVKAVPEEKQRRRYAGSQSEAASTKKAIQEELDLKRTEVGFEEVEIPTNKADLIVWLNKNAV